MDSLGTSSALVVARVIRQYPEKMKWLVHFFPFTLQLMVLFHFTNDQLLTFIDAHVTIALLEKKATFKEFQLFLIHIFKRLEKEYNSKLSFKCYEFKIDLMNTFSVKENLFWIAQCHFPSSALGFQFKLNFENMKSSFENTMFVQKFQRVEIHYYGYPQTIVPALFQPFLMDEHVIKDQFHKFPICHPQNPVSVAPVMPETHWDLKKKFYCRMTQLYALFNSEVYHECFVKCVELLETECYFQLNQHSNLYIWGCLSVILTYFNCSHVLIKSCLNKVKKMIVYESDKMDYALFKQIIYNIQHNVKKEKKMYQFIAQSLPRTSQFCLVSFKTHLGTQLNNIENSFLEVLCLKRNLIVSRLTVRDLIIHKKNIIRNDISTLKKELHYALSLKEENEFSELEHYLLILNFYFAIAKFMIYDFNNFNIQSIIRALDSTFHHLNNLAKLLNHENSFLTPHYRQNMEDIKNNIEKETHTLNSKMWAEISFCHFVFLDLVELDPTFALQLRTDAMAYYKPINHYRAILLTDWETCRLGRPLEFLKVTEKTVSKSFYDNIDVMTLFQKDPTLKYQLFAGLKSIQWYQNYDYDEI